MPNISQCSAATRLRCGGVFNDDVIKELLMRLKVNEFWQSVSIWRSYGQQHSGTYWLTMVNGFSATPCVCHTLTTHAWQFGVSFGLLSTAASSAYQCARKKPWICFLSDWLCVVRCLVQPPSCRTSINWFLWSPYVIEQTIIFLPCDFYFSFFFLSFFLRLISAAVDWMSTILPHMMWP